MYLNLKDVKHSNANFNREGLHNKFDGGDF